MSESPLRKRDREPEALPDSIAVREPKRFHGEETYILLHLLQLDQTLADDGEELEEFAPSEELVNRVMRSLEEEIAATCSTSYPSSNSGVKSAGPDISSGHEVRTRDSDSAVDLRYLLEASDDELGIPPSPVLDLEEEVCQSPKETSESLWEKPDLKSMGENWHFEDHFDNYQQFAMYGNSWDAIQLEDYMNRDFVIQATVFYGDFSAT